MRYDSSARHVDSKLIQVMSYCILRVFKQQNIAVREMATNRNPDKVSQPEYTVSDRLVTFHFNAVHFIDGDKAVKLGNAIETSILRGLQMQGEQLGTRVYHGHGYLNVEVERLDPHLLTWGELAETASELFLLGRDSFFEVVTWDLLSCDGALAVIGPKGGGKTNFARLLAIQAVTKGWKLALLGLKGRDNLEDLPPICELGYAFNNEDAEPIITMVEEEVDARNDGKRPKDTPWLVLWDEMRLTNSDLMERIGTLIVRCRSANVVIMGTTQSMDSRIPNNVKNNIEHRFVTRVQNANISAMETGYKGLGAERLLGKGDMLGVFGGPNDVRRFQTPRADPEDMAGMVEEAKRTIHVPRRNTTPAIVSRNERAPARPTPERIARERIEREKDEDARREPAPIQVYLRAAVHAWRWGDEPTHAQITEWNRHYTGNDTLSQAKRDRVREFAGAYTGIVENYMGLHGLNGSDMGGYILQNTLKHPSHWYACNPCKSYTYER